MKRWALILFSVVALFGCRKDPATAEEEQVSGGISSFSSSNIAVGEKFGLDSVLSVDEMNER